jgi:hypothetical protein
MQKYFSIFQKSLDLIEFRLNKVELKIGFTFAIIIFHIPDLQQTNRVATYDPPFIKLIIDDIFML